MVLNSKENDKEYIKNFLSGYINFYKINLSLYGSDKRMYKIHKIKTMLIYLGIPLKYKRIFEICSPIYLPIEFVFSFLILIYKFMISFFYALRTKKEMPAGKTLMLATDTPSFMWHHYFKGNPHETEIRAVQIPFINSETPYETYSMYSLIKCKDCRRALILSIRLLCHVFKKYCHTDHLFRAYAAYEYFLACIYVERSDESNRFLFVSTNDRWAYLFFNDKKHSNIFVQHGLIGTQIKCKAPHTAYYMSKKQQEFFEKNIFIGKPAKSHFRSSLEFTATEKLKNNGKINLLIICCNNYLDLERKCISELIKSNKYNVYIKPHPLFRDYSEYYALKDKYDIMVLEKADYPQVDKVLSYDSALACEYEGNEVPVLRYSDSDFDKKFQLLLGIE